MESEARLVMIDAELPTPTLQYEIVEQSAQAIVSEAWVVARAAAKEANCG